MEDAILIHAKSMLKTNVGKELCDLADRALAECCNSITATK
jgi:hypothetical protein